MTRVTHAGDDTDRTLLVCLCACRVQGELCGGWIERNRLAEGQWELSEPPLLQLPIRNAVGASEPWTSMDMVFPILDATPPVNDRK